MWDFCEECGEWEFIDLASGCCEECEDLKPLVTIRSIIRRTKYT